MIADVISAEVARAARKFPTWPSDPVHAVAVIAEEVGELQKAVLEAVYEPQKASRANIKLEAIQAAAMCWRFIASLGLYTYAPSVQHKQDLFTPPAAPESAP